jgi:hypothetical protein
MLLHENIKMVLNKNSSLVPKDLIFALESSLKKINNQSGKTSDKMTIQKGLYAECHSAECRYVECRGALQNGQ